jgi:hypothetical protein
MQEKIAVVNYQCDCCKRYLSRDGKPTGKNNHIHIVGISSIGITEYKECNYECEDGKECKAGTWEEEKKYPNKELQFCDFECMMAYFKSFFPEGIK